jgi:hypothetical protein
MRRDRDALRWLSSLPRAAWPVVATALSGLLAFALPDSVRLPWWAPSTLDLVVVAVLGIAFARSRFAVLCGVAASVLGAHAVLVGLARPSTTAAVLWALAAVGVLWDLLPRWVPLAVAGLGLVGRAMTYERHRRDLARVRKPVSEMT